MIALMNFTKYRGVIGRMIRYRGSRLVKSNISTKERNIDFEKIEKELELKKLEEERAILEALRNKSRLIEKDYKIQNNQPPITSTIERNQNKIGYKRTLYGHYGSASNINPSILWPSTEELAAFKEYESVAHPKTLSQHIEDVKRNKINEEKEIAERKKEILAKMEHNEKQIDQFNSRVRESFLKALEIRKKKDKLKSDIRMKIGYDISTSDELFIEEMRKIEEEEKNNLRLMKKAKKLAKKSDKEMPHSQPASKETNEETKPAE